MSCLVLSESFAAAKVMGVNLFVDPLRAARVVCAALCSMVTASLVFAPAQADESSTWNLQASVLAAVPTTPADFRDGWGPGWGMQAFVGRRVSGRTVLGVEGQFQQHQFDGSLPGNEIGGRERRLGTVSARCDVDLWEATGRRGHRLTGELAAGYAHQYIAPVTGTYPLPFGPSDGYGASVGAAYSFNLNRQTRLLFGARHAWAIFPEETVGSLALRFGVAVTLAGEH
jgi:hypothetical protein